MKGLTTEQNIIITYYAFGCGIFAGCIAGYLRDWRLGLMVGFMVLFAFAWAQKTINSVVTQLRLT